MPKSLLGTLKRLDPVTLDLDIAATPLSKCTGTTHKHLTLETKVINVQRKLVTP